MTLQYFSSQGLQGVSTDQVVTFYSASDYDVTAQKAMVSCPSRAKALHNFTDIKFRMSEDFQEELGKRDPGTSVVIERD